MDLSNFIIPGILVLVVLLLGLSFAKLWVRVPQDKAMVISGLRKKVITGGGGLVIPLLERKDIISLENITINVASNGVYTKQSVEIDVEAIAIVKVKSDRESVLSALEQFNTGNEKATVEAIRSAVGFILEGKQREILARMTVEEVYQDRDKFASQVQEIAAKDLANMGLEIKAFTIRDIKDRDGYLEALGKPRIAAVKRDALIAEADAQKEAKIKTSEAAQQGEEAKLIAETRIAEAQKTKEIQIQAYKKDQDSAKAVSDLAYSIQENKTKKEVTETEMQVEITRTEKQIELAEREAQRTERELEASVKKEADAEKYKAEKEAEAKKYADIQKAEAEAQVIALKAKAEADAIFIRGQAEAKAINLKGEAEAAIMKQKAEAFKEYGQQALTQFMIDKLPEIAQAVSEPLSKTEKIVIVDNGNDESAGGASKVPKYVNQILSQVPELVNAYTGINLIDYFNHKTQTSTQATTQTTAQPAVEAESENKIEKES